MKNNSGQALIILIFAIALAITILTGMTVSAITLGKNTRLTETAQKAVFAAESGAEVALLKLIRNPSGCSGNENINIGSSSVDTSYSQSGNVCSITVTANLETVQKKLTLQATITGSRVTYCCWKQLP